MLPQLHLAFHGASYSISTYSMCACLAALLGGILAFPRLRKCGLRPLQMMGLLLLMAAAFLVGARLWNVAVSPANYTGELHWFSLRFAGLSLYGGILGALMVLVPLLLHRRICVWRVLDAFTAPACIAFMVARLGCFLAGCCAGRVTSMPWGVVFPARAPAQEALGRLMPLLGGVKPLHPTQLYELLGAAFCLLLLFLIYRRRTVPPGSRFLLFASLFCLMRLLVLPFRALAYREVVVTVLYPLLYGGLVAIALLLLLVRTKRYPCTEQPEQ